MNISVGLTRKQLACGAVVAALLASLATAQLPSDEKLNEPTKALLEQAGSKDHTVLMEAVVTIDRQQQEVIRILIDRVDPRSADRVDPEARAAAAYLLGVLRAPQAGPALVAALADPRMPENSKRNRASSEIDVLNNRPAYFALMLIGMPVVPAVVAKIEQTDDLELRRDLLEILSRTLWGKRPLVEMLQKVEVRAADLVAKERVKQARLWVEEFHGNGEQPLFW